MNAVIRLVRRLGRDRSGISSIEYALLVAFIGGGIVAAANTLSESVSDELNNAANCIDGTLDPCEF